MRMLKSELLGNKACCFKCHYGRSCIEHVRIIPNDLVKEGYGRVFSHPSELRSEYPDIDDSKLISDSMIYDCRCHKLPPRVYGGVAGFPQVNPDSWCGSFKAKEVSNDTNTK